MGQLQLSFGDSQKKREKRRAPAAKPKDASFAEAMRDARDIREWTDGPHPAPFRVYRLALALSGRA